MKNIKIYQTYITDFATHYSFTEQTGSDLLTNTQLDILFISLINFARPCTATKTIKFRFDYLKRAGLTFDKDVADYLDANLTQIVSNYKI